MKRLLLIPALVLAAFSVMGQSVAYKVNNASTALYETSTAPFNKLATLKRGETVLLVERVGGVMKVAYNGKTGFVNADNLVAADKYLEDAQNAWHPVAAKKDNQIMATTSLPVKDAYKAIQLFLMENNYNIERADEATGYITATAPLTKGMGQGSVRLNIFLKAEDSTRAYYQGAYDASVGGLMTPSMNLTGVIEKMGMKGSTMENAFTALDAAARAIPNSTIRYRKKPKQ